MCGIYGMAANQKLSLLTRATLASMGKTLRQRGPDDQGEKLKGQVGIGATRLSIIDLPGGNQPLFNEDKSVWVVQNGELYNYKEIRLELEKSGHKFSSQSDTEVYAHLYEELGLKFVDKLRGMYGLALWDENKKQLLLVRDRLGIKPVYYAQIKDLLVFASEIKAILKAGISKELDQLALHDYLAVNYVPGPRTIFKSIKKLPPGHMLIWRDGKILLKRYWNPSTSLGRAHFKSIQDCQRELLELLEEAVKYHLVSDVPVGAFLSGGIDSSLVVALASQFYAKPIKTFSVGFEQESFNELKYAKAVACKFKTVHQEVKLKLKPQELINKIGSYFDEPFADSSAVAVYAISRVAKENKMKVILTGDGGDEIFGGYVTYQADQLLKFYNRLPRWVREKFISFWAKRLPASHKKMTFEFKAKRFIRGALEDPLKSHFLWKAIFTDEQINSLRRKPLAKVRPCYRLWQKVYAPIDSPDTLNKLMLTDMQTSLVDDMLTKVDRMSMANSLEVRVPLLDHKLVEFMLKLPSKYKVRGFNLKYLLKKTMRGLLPDEILNRKKAGFHVPVADWVKNELKELIGAYLSADTLTKQGYFDPKFVQKLLKDHNELKADYSREIWGLLMFSIWQERYLT